MLGGTDVHSRSPLETCTGLARASVRKRGSVFLVPTNGESNYPSDLFFQEPIIPQLRNCHTSGRGSEGVPGQGHELAWILFIPEGECNKEAVLDVLPTHDAMLCARARPRTGPSVPVFGYLCSLCICPLAMLDMTWGSVTCDVFDSST
jgi:hypothetical protein